MYASIRITATPSKAASAKLSRAAQSFHDGPKPLSYASRADCLFVQRNGRTSFARHFSSTAPTQLKEYLEPPKNAPNIKLTGYSWEHPVYTYEQMESIIIAHREARTWSDKVAVSFMRLLRWGTDLCTGYRHDNELSKGNKTPEAANARNRFRMDERKWLVRIVFLESVAGVPGMVAASLRHLRSLRRMQRDNGWIETLLEEAYNERMHLLTFLKLAEPGYFMRFLILGAQGVFYNSLFVSYLISPRTVHRFVGYLEEEAVLTYTRCIADLDAGKLPKWQKMQAPEIAISYWNMPEGKRTMRDLLLYVRADEAKHREVNHTLGNLEQNQDPNPFLSQYKDPEKPHPSKGIESIKPIGWEREDVI